MKSIFRQLTKYCYLFLFGGLAYYLIEVLWRGHSHMAMAVVGGLCFVLIGLINESLLHRGMPLVSQMTIAAGIITFVELVAGLILNRWLGLAIWDYSNLPLNLLGQICPQFFGVWWMLSLIGITLDDYIRYWFFKEEKPEYRFF
ncbi:putative ABC transporter permease [Marasmitruncus massiliensis]|uniref:putative ABC transporter permease n=1 Tax=Marasmitruncus massiliensis TaxID=1944642 RepID=UPI000C7E2034|nr:hypothetical protein [Marasmitruncus massiliensis]